VRQATHHFGPAALGSSFSIRSARAFVISFCADFRRKGIWWLHTIAPQNSDVSLGGRPSCIHCFCSTIWSWLQVKYWQMGGAPVLVNISPKNQGHTFYAFITSICKCSPNNIHWSPLKHTLRHALNSIESTHQGMRSILELMHSVHWSAAPFERHMPFWTQGAVGNWANDSILESPGTCGGSLKSHGNVLTS